MYLCKDSLRKFIDVNKYKLVGMGATSIIYERGKNKVLGYTLDPMKIKWLKVNKKLFKFKLLRKIKYTINTKYTLYEYEMLKLKPLKQHQKDYVFNVLIDMCNKLYRQYDEVGYALLVDLMVFIEDRELKELLYKIWNTFKNDDIALDLHEKQFMSLDGNIVCIDPVIPKDLKLNKYKNFKKY